MTKKPRQKLVPLVARMAELGESTTTLSRKAGVHFHTLSRVINKRQAATPKTATRIARALGSTPEALGLPIYDGFIPKRTSNAKEVMNHG